MAFRCDAGTNASHDGGGIGGSLLRRVRFIRVGSVRYLQLRDLLSSPYGSSRGDPSWVTPTGMAALGFLSAAMGLQGAMGTVSHFLQADEVS